MILLSSTVFFLVVVRMGALLLFCLTHFSPPPIRQADQNEDSCNKPSNLPEIS